MGGNLGGGRLTFQQSQSYNGMFKDKHIHVFQWSKVQTEIKSNLWQDRKTAPHEHSPSHLPELQLFCQEG